MRQSNCENEGRKTNLCSENRGEKQTMFLPGSHADMLPDNANVLPTLNVSRRTGLELTFL